MRFGTVSEEQQAEVVRLYVHGGLTYKQVAERTHWSPTQVRRILLASGVTPRANGTNTGRAQLSADEVLTRAQLYGEGYSLAEVADICGVSVTAVVRSLERNGVKRRKVGDALRIAYRRGRRAPSGAAAGRAS